MARDPKRIDRIIDLVRDIWKKCPDLRLLQLLGNTVHPDYDPYYIEDDVLEKNLRRTYNEEKAEEEH